MLVYDNMTNRICEIRAEDFSGLRHLASQHWSKRQRQQFIDQFIRFDETVANYLEGTTNRINLFKTAFDRMVEGTLPLNVKVLYILLQDVVWECKWRVK